MADLSKRDPYWIKEKTEMVSNLSHVFLLLSIILLSIIDSIELRKLLDIDKLEFKFPCGSVQCDGIRQYCSDELTCLYCNEAVCRDTNRPGLCTFQCEKEEMGKKVKSFLISY